MTKKLKPFKPEVENCCYVDMEKRFAIGYDEWQWILQKGKNRTYYRTTEHLFYELARKMMVIPSLDTKAVLSALHSLKTFIKEVSEGIELPERKHATRK